MNYVSHNSSSSSLSSSLPMANAGDGTAEALGGRGAGMAKPSLVIICVGK